MGEIITISPYPGGKTRNALSYRPFIPYKDIDTYIEPFSGMWGVGLNKARHPVEIYNDWDNELVHLVRLLSDKEKGMEVLRMLHQFPYTKDFFNYAKGYLNNVDFQDDNLYAGALVWATFLFSYNGQGTSFRGIHKGTELAEIHRKLMKKIYTIQRLQGVTVLKEDANDLIKKYKEDSRTCLFTDPPYPPTHKSGKNERHKIYKAKEMLKIKEQIAFLENLEGAKAKIFVCSYENELYNEILCKNFGWKCVPVTDTYKYMAVSGLGQSKERVTEVGYINYDHKECR